MCPLGTKPIKENVETLGFSSSKKSLALPKGERLKSKKAFEALFAEGKSIASFPLRLRYARVHLTGKKSPKVAVSAPKRKFRGAVKRNRVKRLVREAYRLNKHLVFNKVEGDFALLFLYLGDKAPTFLEVERAMQRLLKEFLKKESHEKNN